jgi:two-component system LytT family response regulator
MIVSKVLGHFDALLSSSHFIRIHRTHLVNLLCIKQYERGNIPKIGLNNDEILPVSRSRKKILQQEMRLHVRT